MGWIDPAGRFWTCAFASHELLLHFLGVPVREAEDKGWIRVTGSGAHGIFRPTDAQIRTLVDKLDMAGAAKRMQEEGFKPGSMARKKGYSNA